MLADGRVEGTPSTVVSMDEVRDAALAALRKESSSSQTLETVNGPVTLFLEVFPRQPKLVVFGGNQTAVALVPLARFSATTQSSLTGARHFSTLRDFRRKTGLSEARVARLHGPIGLDLGGKQPAGIALSILAEMTAVRYARSASQRENSTP